MGPCAERSHLGAKDEAGACCEEGCVHACAAPGSADDDAYGMIFNVIRACNFSDFYNQIANTEPVISSCPSSI